MLRCITGGTIEEFTKAQDFLVGLDYTDQFMVQILSQSKALLTSMGIDSNMVCSLGNFTKKSKQPQDLQGGR